MDTLKRKSPEKTAGSDSEGERKRIKREKKAAKAEKRARKAAALEENGDVDMDAPETTANGVSPIKPKKRKRRESELGAVDADTLDPVTVDDQGKYASVFKKLSKVKSRLALQSQQKDAEGDVDMDAEPEPQVPALPLAPIPQPEVARESQAISALSALPEFLAAPTTIPSTRKAPFKDLGVSEKIRHRLEKRGFSQAFAVQSAIIPLLLRKPFEHEDLLVSAATGSGKTLGYAIPIIQSLSQRRYVCLRAMVIVPTRELVNQVRDEFEAVASGTGLKIGATSGGRSLKQERKMLVRDEWEDFYEPEDYMVADTPRWRSNIDILITTPGRLVEHIQSTPGFSLDNLEWLIMDEADKLMNQSFQEWLGIITQALKNNFSNQDPYKIEFGDVTIHLGAMGLRNSPENTENRCLRKVVLSATMTRDIGQISELKLKSPRLIVVEETLAAKKSLKDKKLAAKEAAAIVQMEGGSELAELFTVPNTLREHAVRVKELADKPLYLLNLLHEQGMSKGVLVFTRTNENAGRLWRLLQLVFSAPGAKISRKVGLATKEMDRSTRKRMVKEFRREEIDMYSLPTLLRVS